VAFIRTEDFFSILKRGVVGTHHHGPPPHASLPCRVWNALFDQGLNDTDRAALILKGKAAAHLSAEWPARSLTTFKHRSEFAGAQALDALTHIFLFDRPDKAISG
jgi:hypothetical protein